VRSAKPVRNLAARVLSTSVMRGLGAADVWHGQGPVIDNALHYDCRGEPVHAGKSGELLVTQGLVGGQVGGGDPQQVVGVAEQALGAVYLNAEPDAPEPAGQVGRPVA
jgi:hypothetical protein